MKPILVFYAMSVAVTIYNQPDAVMPGFMKEITENSDYDAAVKIKMILINVLTALGTVIMPRAVYHLKNGNREMFNVYSDIKGELMK